MGMLEDLKTVDITPWLKNGGPMVVPVEYRTASAAAPLPSDQRGFFHTAARLNKIRQFAQGGKFRDAGDFQARSPAQLKDVRSRAAKMAKWSVPPLRTADGTDAFVDDVRGADLYAATYCRAAGVDVATIAPLLTAAFSQLASSDAWDMYQRGTGGGYMFSAAKVGGYIGAAYGLYRYNLTPDIRRAMEEKLARNAWYAIGSIATGHNNTWFPNRLKGDYAKHATTYYANTWKFPNTPYFSVGVDQRDGLQKWLVPSTASSMDNQFAALVWMAAMGACANPSNTPLRDHAVRCLLEFIQFAVHGPTGLTGEVGARQDDYNYPPQGRTYTSMILQFLGGAAGSLLTTFGDRRAVDFVTSAGVMGSEGGPKDYARTIAAQLDLISGKLPFQSSDRLATAKLPTTPVPKNPARSYGLLVKDGREKTHEVTYASLLDVWPSLAPLVRAYYTRTGDFARIPLPGTQGTPDSGNDYGTQYTGLVDPIPLFSFQDYLIGENVAPAPAPTPGTPTPAPTPPSPSTGAGEASEVHFARKVESANGKLRAHFNAGASTVLLRGTAEGEVWLLGQSGEQDIQVATSVRGDWRLLEPAAEVPPGVYVAEVRSAAGSTRTPAFTLDASFFAEPKAEMQGADLVASVAVWGDAILTASAVGPKGTTTPMTVAPQPDAERMYGRATATLKAPAPGTYAITMFAASGGAKTITYEVPSTGAPPPPPAVVLPPVPVEVDPVKPGADVEQLKATIRYLRSVADTLEGMLPKTPPAA